MSLAKRVDAKGRLTLGPSFANLIVLIHENRVGELVIQKADVVPSNESWLYANQKVHHAVKKGLHDASQKKFVKDPMEDEDDMTWLNDIKE